MSQQPAEPSTPAARDSLTGALARPSLIALLNEQAAHAQRTGNVFCLCLLDVDRLRSINDSRGVAAGDALLAALAARLRSVLEEPAWHRSEYTLARYDGGALHRARSAVQRASGRDAGRGAAFRRGRGAARRPQSATVSIGVAQHRIGESIDSLLARTERTMYLAKQFGRDRVEVSPTPPSRVERAKVVGIRD